MRRSTAGSEQTAAPGTPSTSNALKSPATPAKAAPPAPKHAGEPDSPSVQVPRTARAHKPSRIVPKSNPQPGGGVAHPGSHDPRLAPRPQRPGAFAEDPGDSRGVPTVECGAPAPLEDLDDIEVAFAAEIADADALDPCTHAEAKRAPDRPLWVAAAKKSATHKARPVAQSLNHTTSVDPDDTLSTAPPLAGNPRPAHWAASKRITFTLSDTPDPPFTHGKASSPPDGSANANGSTASDWPAISGRASLIDGGAIPSPLKRKEDIPSPSTGESDYAAATHGRKEASQHCSLISDTPGDPKASWLRSLASAIFGNLPDLTTHLYPSLPPVLMIHRLLFRTGEYIVVCILSAQTETVISYSRSRSLPFALAFHHTLSTSLLTTGKHDTMFLIVFYLYVWYFLVLFLLKKKVDINAQQHLNSKSICH